MKGNKMYQCNFGIKTFIEIDLIIRAKIYRALL